MCRRCWKIQERRDQAKDLTGCVKCKMWIHHECAIVKKLRHRHGSEEVRLCQSCSERKELPDEKNADRDQDKPTAEGLRSRVSTGSTMQADVDERTGDKWHYPDFSKDDEG